MNEKIEPTELTKIDCDRQLGTTRFSPCGQFLIAGGYDASIRRWDIREETPRELPALEGHHGWVTWLEFHPSEDLLLSVDSWGALRAVENPGETGKLRWSHEQAHNGWIRALSLRQDGSLVATGGRDRCARVWSTKDGALAAAFPDHPGDVYAVAIHPREKTLVTADLYGTIRRWDLETKTLLGETKFEKMHYYERIQDVGGLRLLRFYDDGATLLCIGAEPQHAGRSIAIPTVHWLKWPSMEIQHTAQFGPERHGFLFDMHRHPHGYWAAVSSGQPGNGQFLLLRDGETTPFFLTTKMSNCHGLDVHPDGRLVVAASNRNSQGNGAVRDKEGNYVGNYSPLHIFAPPPQSKAKEESAGQAAEPASP